MTRRLNVYICAYWHDPRFKKRSGGLVRMFSLADNLKDIGYNPILLLPRIGYPQKQTSAKVIEIPFIDLPILRPLSFHIILSLYMLFKATRNADIFYIRQMNSFLPVLIPKLFKKPSFFEVPNDPYINYDQKGKIRGFIERIMDTLSLKLTDRIIVLSEWSKNRLSKLGGIPRSKIRVMPSGTDTEVFKPLEKDACCQKLGLDSSFYYIGFVGSFLAHQGIDTLIDAAQSIIGDIENARFLLVGDGPMKSKWKDKVSILGLEDCFIFTGHVPYLKVPIYIGAMDICIAPHKKESNQSSPVKIFDYMACGKPIVASDIEVIHEITNHSGCCLTFPPNDHIRLAEVILGLIKDKSKRKKMGKNGREWAIANFDRKELVKKLFLRTDNYIKSSTGGSI